MLTLSDCSAGARVAGGVSVRQSTATAIGRRKLLLVLDNCEHVIDAVAGLIPELLHHCPGLAVVVTSREPLGVEGERTLAVPSLDIDSEAPPPGSLRTTRR